MIMVDPRILGVPRMMWAWEEITRHLQAA